MAATPRAVDASYDLLTREEAQCLKKNGTELYIQCAWTAVEQPPVRVESLREADNGGLDIALYISLNSRGSGADHVRSGLAGVPYDLLTKLKFVAIDVELDGITEVAIWEAINELNRQSLRPVIYTSYNVWTTMVVPRNPSSFSARGIPLWNAYWDGKPDLDFPGLRFGGWSDDQVVLEQYSGGTDVCGQFVDRNAVFDLELLYDTSIDPPEDVPDVPIDPIESLLDSSISLDGHSPMTLGDALRRGVVAFDALQVTETALIELRGYAARHVQLHNETGGAQDRYSGEFLEKVAGILNNLEQTFIKEAQR